MHPRVCRCVFRGSVLDEKGNEGAPLSALTAGINMLRCAEAPLKDRTHPAKLLWRILTTVRFTLVKMSLIAFLCFFPLVLS